MNLFPGERSPMSPISVFRWSLVLSPAVGIAGVVYTHLAFSHFSQDWQDLIAWSGDGSWLPEEASERIDVATLLMIGGLLVFALAAIANQIAMYFFWPPSRHIYSLTCVIGIPLTLGLGLTVLPPVEMLSFELSSFIAGVTLAMAYLSPVAERFNRRFVGDPDGSRPITDESV